MAGKFHVFAMAAISVIGLKAVWLESASAASTLHLIALNTDTTCGAASVAMKLTQKNNASQINDTQKKNPSQPNDFPSLRLAERGKGVDSPDAALLSSLKELGEVCHHIKGSAKDLIAETQRADLIEIGEPTTIGSMIIPAVPNGSGALPMGNFIPARKKWVDYFMSHLSFLMPQLEAQIASLGSNPAISSSEYFRDMKNEFTNIQTFYSKLTNVTAAAPYVNVSIATQAEGVNIEADRIDKDRKELDKLVKRDAKAQ